MTLCIIDCTFTILHICLLLYYCTFTMPSFSPVTYCHCMFYLVALSNSSICMRKHSHGESSEMLQLLTDEKDSVNHYSFLF